METSEIQNRHCFLCRVKIVKSPPEVPDDQESSFILKHILEVPHLDNYLERVKGQHISYCSHCSSKISKVRDVLEELEKLEKVLLDEKYEIELQFRRNSDVHSSESTEGQGQEPVNKIRRDIVTDLRSSSIYSMMEKLYKKQVGRRPDPRKSIRTHTFPGVRTNSSSSTVRTALNIGVHNKNYSRTFPQRKSSGMKISQVRSVQSAILNNNIIVPQPHSSHSTSASYQFQSAENLDKSGENNATLNMDSDVDVATGQSNSNSEQNYGDIFQPEVLINDEVGPDDYAHVKLEGYEEDAHSMVIEPHIEFPSDGDHEDLFEEKFSYNNFDQEDPDATAAVELKVNNQLSLTPQHVVGWPGKPPRRPRVRICTNSFESLEAFDTANALDNDFPRTYCKFHSRNYSTRRELRVHVKAMHLPAALKYKCDWPTCDKVFSKPSTLLRHTRAHKTNISKAEFMNINLSGLPS